MITTWVTRAAPAVSPPIFRISLRERIGFFFKSGFCSAGCSGSREGPGSLIFGPFFLFPIRLVFIFGFGDFFKSPALIAADKEGGRTAEH